jgi:hypothetical protein
VSALPPAVRAEVQARLNGDPVAATAGSNRRPVDDGADQNAPPLRGLDRCHMCLSELARGGWTVLG